MNVLPRLIVCEHGAPDARHMFPTDRLHEVIQLPVGQSVIIRVINRLLGAPGGVGQIDSEPGPPRLNV